jgi:histidinol-phosphate/aromatic aminotransferase/cobyric acid decarboxylase-like protein
MFVIDFDERSVQRLARGEDGAVMVIDEAFNEGIGRHTTAEQMQEISE